MSDLSTKVEALIPAVGHMLTYKTRARCVERVTRVLEEQVREEREASIRDVCRYCRQGCTLTVKGFHIVPGFHDDFIPCDAAAIRSRGEGR